MSIYNCKLKKEYYFKSFSFMKGIKMQKTNTNQIRRKYGPNKTEIKLANLTHLSFVECAIIFLLHYHEPENYLFDMLIEKRNFRLKKYPINKIKN